MFAIELFRKYVKNSTVGISNSQKLNKLNYMGQQVREILLGLEHGFAGDDSLYDKDDHTIYTLMKKDLFADMLTGNTESVRCTGETMLNSVLTEIEGMMVGLVA